MAYRAYPTLRVIAQSGSSLSDTPSASFISILPKFRRWRASSLFVGIDRTSKFAVTQPVDKANRKTPWELLEHLLQAAPYHIHIIHTDNGILFAEQPRNRNTAHSRPMCFDMICNANEIEHRLTKSNHPWNNGKDERMNQTIKDATVKRCHYDNHEQLRIHLADFIAAYNFVRWLKTIKGLTPR